MPDKLPLEWVVVPVADEAEAEQRRHDSEKMRLFLLEFSLDDMPACPVGMALLMAFAEKHPSMYTVARRAAFSEPAHPFFRVNPAWLAFAKHRGGCYDCCECGPPVPYDYFFYAPPTADELQTYEAAAKTPEALAALHAYQDALGAIEEEQRAGRTTTPQRRKATAARRALDAELGLRPIGPHIN